MRGGRGGGSENTFHFFQIDPAGAFLAEALPGVPQGARHAEGDKQPGQKHHDTAPIGQENQGHREENPGQPEGDAGADDKIAFPRALAALDTAVGAENRKHQHAKEKVGCKLHRKSCGERESSGPF